jgi:predicted transcriptional regulator
MSKNVTRTVRLDADLDTAIQEKAKEANTSVNNLVNRVIRKYVDWDVPAAKFGLGPVAAGLLNHLFQDVDEEAAFDLGRGVAHEFTQPFTTYLFGELTLETSIMLWRRAADYGGRYTFDINSDKEHHVFVLRHNGGLRLSTFYSGIFQGLYSEILKIQVKVESTKDYCVVQIPAAAFAK